MSKTIELAKQLIACPSITPHDAGCQEILIQRLKKLDFHIEQLPFGDVKNFWAKRGTQQPLLAFAGHTDVVPPGSLDQWTSPPFQPEIRNGHLYGRGSADMKGNIAAMLIACENFISQHPHHKGSIAWLITSDEEGPSIDGTAKVVEYLKQRHEKIDYCIVGESTSEQQLGDTLKIGRRGSLSGHLKIHGKQGHIAYPHHADNAIHKALSSLTELIQTEWDKGNDFFQPTSLQISNIHAGIGANNVIPGVLEIQFNFRYSPEVTAKQLQNRFEKILEKHKIKYDIQWHNSGNAFQSKQGKLVDVCTAAIKEITGITSALSTNGGTSDARFIVTMDCEIIDFGVCNHTIHQINESASVEELEKLTQIYQLILGKILR